MRIAAAVIAALVLSPDAHAQAGARALDGPIEFTVATGVLVGEVRGAASVKVDDYVYIPDPVGHGLTMAGVAIHLKKYDRSRPTPSLAERFTVITGGLVTPSGGLAVGGSWMLVRHVAINAGLAIMLVHASRDGLPIGAVAEPLDSPFETGVARAWFIGGNYTFR